MTTSKDGGPAFPYSALVPDKETRQMIGTMYADNKGMTLRDYFAAKAMQAQLANENWNLEALQAAGITNQFAVAAASSYRYADAMLQARTR